MTICIEKTKDNEYLLRKTNTVQFDMSDVKVFEGNRDFEIVEKKQILDAMTFEAVTQYNVELSSGEKITINCRCEALADDEDFGQVRIIDEDLVQSILVKLGLLHEYYDGLY